MQTVVVLRSDYSPSYRALISLSLFGLSLISIMCGVGRTISCGFFFNSAIDLIDSLALIGAALYVAVISEPKPLTIRLLFYSLLGLSVVLCLFGVFCLILEIAGAPGLPALLITPIIGRSHQAHQGCADLFKNVTEQISPPHLKLIRLVSYVTSGSVGFFQLLIITSVLFRIQTVYKPRRCKAPHVHMVLGFLALVSGSVHLVYCCRYFYVGLGIVSGLTFLSVGLYHSNSRFPPKPVLLILNFLTLLFSGALVPVSGLGLFCWFPYDFLNSTSPFFDTQSHEKLVINSPVEFANNFACVEEKDEIFKLARLANGNLYGKCLKGLKVMGYWSDESSDWFYSYAWTHLKFIQMSACAILSSIGAVEFLFSLITLLVVWTSD